jgi:23S rRNA (cytosine1962-C5)-methyltransferase
VLRTGPMLKSRVMTLTAGAAAAVKQGHPWIWREGVGRGFEGGAAGQVVELRDPTGAAIGQGIWDPSSPIAVRVYSSAIAPPLDARMIGAAIERAMARRRHLIDDPATTAYRLCHGEGDRVPGIVIDRYGEVAVLRLDGEGIVSWLPELGPVVWQSLVRLGIRSLGYRLGRRAEGARGEGARLEPLSGAAPPRTVSVKENGIAMIVDLAEGQKTGAFLDQRDNRQRVRELARGRRVLNLFSYAGGFSTAAVLGGARQVTSVDIAQAAHATAQLSLRENGSDPEAHVFVTSDVFSFLAAAQRKKDKWDLVVSDPPSFAPSEKARPRALSAYRKLHRACAAVLAPDGILCAGSCSSHVTADDFATTLDDAALGRSDLSLVGIYGPPWDHPSLAGWPQGRYLKFAILA